VSAHVKRMFWLPILALVGGLFWLVWAEARAGPGGYLFGMHDAATEAGYCLAVAERGRELTRGQGAARLEAFLGESIDFWRGRGAGSALVAGRMALASDVAPPVEEQVHLHLALQACGQRAVGLYGHRFASMEGG
jgi:hypothetical protein